MSEYVRDAANGASDYLRSAADGVQHAKDRLLDSQGRPINQTAGAANDTMRRVEDYVHQQPVRAALIALGVGYVVGRLRLFI